MNYTITSRPLASVCHIAAIALFAGACTVAGAQEVSNLDAAPQQKLVAMNLAPSQPLNLAASAGLGYSSSMDVDTSSAGTLDLNLPAESGLQPPPRRRYGRPRYNDSSHNPDGSNKYEFIAGVGLTLPVGNTYKYLNSDYAFQFGAGRRYSNKFAVLVQFDYDHFGFNAQTIYNQNVLYGTFGYGLDGKSHVWSFTLDPTFSLYQSEGIGAYGTIGAGFYHKTANFTIPSTGEYEDAFGNIYQYQANQTIDKYTSNAPGFDAGFGLTYKPSRFAGEKFYVEAKYVYVINSQRFGITVANANANATYTGSNFFPSNSNRTSYIPIKAGIRF